jgi:GntR family transcriptional regulator
MILPRGYQAGGLDAPDIHRPPGCATPGAGRSAGSSASASASLPRRPVRSWATSTLLCRPSGLLRTAVHIPRPVCSIYQQIAAILRAQIETGELVPDRPIPSESTLMQRYGVARETARKAVRVLVAEALVYVVQGRGAYVTWHG